MCVCVCVCVCVVNVKPDGNSFILLIAKGSELGFKKFKMSTSRVYWLLALYVLLISNV